MFKYFQTKKEKDLNSSFLKFGYIIKKVDKKNLDLISTRIKKFLIKKLYKKRF